MVANIYQTISYSYGSDLCLRPYGWRPMTQTSMHLRQSYTYRSVNLLGFVCSSKLCLELCCFYDTINLSGDLWCSMSEEQLRLKINEINKEIGSIRVEELETPITRYTRRDSGKANRLETKTEQCLAV
jgi:hypothetical protein